MIIKWRKNVSSHVDSGHEVEEFHLYFLYCMNIVITDKVLAPVYLGDNATALTNK